MLGQMLGRMLGRCLAAAGPLPKCLAEMLLRGVWPSCSADVFGQSAWPTPPKGLLSAKSCSGRPSRCQKGLFCHILLATCFSVPKGPFSVKSCSGFLSRYQKGIGRGAWPNCSADVLGQSAWATRLGRDAYQKT